MRDPALWQKIRASLIPGQPTHAGLEGDPEAGALETRLTEAENWDPGYARGAVEEYGRFFYLSRVSPNRVTPSKIIDTVWHTHISDSRAYIEDFCRTLFGEIVHHEPSKGPMDASRHEVQFAATLALYRVEFGIHVHDAVQFRFLAQDKDLRSGCARFRARLFPRLAGHRRLECR